MPPYKYLVISYKPSYQDVCRGCVMGTYWEDYRLQRFETEAEVIDHLFRIEDDHAQPDLHGRPKFEAKYKHWALSPEQVFGGDDIDETVADCENGYVPEDIWTEVQRRLMAAKQKRENDKLTETETKTRQAQIDREKVEREELSRLLNKYGQSSKGDSQ